MEEATRKFSRQAVRDEIWKPFGQSVFYHQSEFQDEAGYKSLAERLDKIDKERGTRGNRLFYLAVAPDQFEPIVKNLKAAGLNEAVQGKLGARDRRETVRHRSRFGPRAQSRRPPGFR